MKPKHKNTESVEAVQIPQLSAARKVMYTAIMVLLPLVLLALLEIGLRAFKYGGEQDIVITRRIGNAELYSINRSVANRYFAQAGTTVPEPADDTFEIQKQKQTKRIFCLGESTMAGFPFEFHATAPGFLRDRLQTALPQYNIEVINVGLSAVSSFVVLDFIRELTAYEPDLFVVYVGHNEFYGAYGSGSTVAITGGPWMTRLTLRLLKFRSFLLLRDAHAGVLRWFSSTDVTGTMMQQMAASKTIAYGSPLYNDAKEIYRENLTRIIEAAQTHNVPVVFSTLVSNLKDQPPFVSVFSAETSPEHRKEWTRLVLEGDSAVGAGRLAEAAIKYNEASGFDSLNAEAFYKLGKTLYALQRFDESRTAFITAKDRDALRFRATEEFQDILIQTCGEYDVPLARVDSAYAANSTHGIIGGELILEHLHPNVEGYFLMAKTLAEAIKASNLLTQQNEWEAGEGKTDAELMELSTVSEFDRIVGNLKVEFLKGRWPFHTGPTKFDFVPQNRVEEVSLQYVQNRIGWSDARYLLAEYYAGIKNYELARKECRAVAKVIPFSYNPLLRIADYYRMEGKREESIRAYKECIAVEDNPYARIKLGLTYLEAERATDALGEFEAVFAVNKTFGEPLKAEVSSAARYLFAVAYAKLGRTTEAREQIQRALVLNPSNEDAKDLLRQIEEPSQR